MKAMFQAVGRWRRRVLWQLDPEAAERAEDERQRYREIFKPGHGRHRR